jgi:hypothetical protein
MCRIGQYSNEKETMKAHAEAVTHDFLVMYQNLGHREPTIVGTLMLDFSLSESVAQCSAQSLDPCSQLAVLQKG